MVMSLLWEGVIIQFLNLLTLPFFFNDRNYQWASKNCAHVETLNTILILFILSKRRCSDPSRSRPRPFFKKIQTESVATNHKGYALY